MKKFLNNIRKNSIAALVGFVIIGVLLIAFPSIVSTISGYIVGGLAVGFGVTKIISFFRNSEKKGMSLFSLVVGIIFAVLGVYIIANPEIVSEFLISIFGSVLLIYGIVKLKNALSLKKSGLQKWFSVFLNSLIALLLGIVFVINPSLSHDMMMRVLGGGFVVVGLSDLWTFLTVTKEYNTIKFNDKGEIEVKGREISSEDTND